MAIIGVALAMTPRAVRQAYTDKRTGISEPAEKQMREAIADAVMQAYETIRRPTAIGHGAKAWSPPEPPG